MTRAYEVDAAPSWHHMSHHIPDHAVVCIAAAAVLGVWRGSVSGLCLSVVTAVVVRPRHVAAWCAIATILGGALGAHAWDEASPRRLGPFQGWVQVVADPAPLGSGLRLTVEVEGERFDAWVYGGRRTQLEARQAGEWLWVVGERTALSGDGHRERVRHVVGRFRLQASGDTLPGNGLARAGNRVRTALRASAERTMPAADAALFTGLVIGDDARQPRWMIDSFRASGLSHLTAVSGQNVGFLLAAALPLLRRLRTWWRWSVSVGLIGWFMAVTRFEPSVLRAGVMAILAITAFALGRQPRPVRLVAWAVLVLVLADPMLVWSVGFWLSVGATLGVCLVGPWLAARLPGPAWWRVALGVSLGAQAGVGLPAVLVFHRLPVVSVAANLAAVPVAGFVMLYGLPAGLLAAVLPQAVAPALMAPAVLGTRWVATVARVAAAVEPSGAVAWLLWAAGGGVLLVVLRRRSRAATRRVPI